MDLTSAKDGVYRNPAQKGYQSAFLAPQYCDIHERNAYFGSRRCPFIIRVEQLFNQGTTQCFGATGKTTEPGAWCPWTGAYRHSYGHGPWLGSISHCAWIGNITNNLNEKSMHFEGNWKHAICLNLDSSGLPLLQKTCDFIPGKTAIYSLQQLSKLNQLWCHIRLCKTCKAVMCSHTVV